MLLSRRAFWIVLTIAASALPLAGGPAAAEDPPTADLYVAPGGNDQWTGRLPEAKPDGTDGPLATLGRARDLVAAMKPTGPVRVLLRGGVYRLSEPVVFSSAHSGSKEAPITYEAYPGEQPVLSGGVPVTGWQSAGGPLWKAALPGVKEGRLDPRQLFVGGRRATPARTPNEGFFRSGGPGGPESKTSIHYQGEDVKPWADADEAVVVVYHSWTTSRHRIKSIDAQKRLLEFTAPSGWAFGYWEANQRYYVESVREALDAPGEFYVDHKAGEILYYPRPGEDMTKIEVVAPVIEELLRIEGDAAAGKPVTNLRFVGLAFHHTSWTMPKAEMVDGQAAAELATAAVRAVGARECLFERCKVAHTGGYGLWLTRGSKDNRLDQCHLFDLGAGGVRLGETDLPAAEPLQAERNEVHNCFLHDGGKVYHAGVGVWIGKSSHNRVHHNEICDFLYTGVSVGWSWGYAPTSAHHNLVEFNHIHHLGWGQLSDMGGIYHLGVAPGTVLRGNHIHDVLSYAYGGWGLYTDEGSTEVLLENNLVYRVKDGAFHQHYGRDNVVRNNVLALSASVGQIIRSREEEHNSFTLKRNIIYGATTPPLGSNWNRGGFTLEKNLYWNTDPAKLVFPGGKTLAAWQAAGHDAGSVAADPKFVDPAKLDFRLQPDSPALKLGFQPIDPAAAGLVGPKEWTDLPKQIERPAMKLPGE